MVHVYRKILSIAIVCMFALFKGVVCAELTFELPDNAKQCFYQDIDKDIPVTLEYQVISGGRYDVDCKVEDPNGLELYNKRKEQYDSYQWDTQKKGVYKICFSNEFSTITHKVIYFDLQYGAEPPMFPDMAKTATLGQMETSVVTIHEQLNGMMEYQTRFRLREATGRIFATSLSEKVQIWSFLQMMILVIVAIGQVVILRSFFSDGRHRRSTT